MERKKTATFCSKPSYNIPENKSNKSIETSWIKYKGLRTKKKTWRVQYDKDDNSPQIVLSINAVPIKISTSFVNKYISNVF